MISCLLNTTNDDLTYDALFEQIKMKYFKSKTLTFSQKLDDVTAEEYSCNVVRDVRSWQTNDLCKCMQILVSVFK